MTEIEDENQYSMILVMGVTGSGKSYFVNSLAAGAVVEGHGIISETAKCQVVRLQIGSNLVALVDTPGFDDTYRSDDEILDEISQFLVVQYKLGISLKGIIYLHRITDPRMQGNARRYYELFKRLCGKWNFKSVVLLTTMWSELQSRGLGLRREQQLRQEFWNEMERHGSEVRGFDGSRAMAEGLVCRLMREESIVLDIQRELVDENKRLDETSAGQLFVPSLESQIAESSVEIKNLEARIAKATGREEWAEKKRLEGEKSTLAEKQRRREARRQRLRARPGEEVDEEIKASGGSGKWKNRVAIFASVLGLVISATVQIILPLAGVSCTVM